MTFSIGTPFSKGAGYFINNQGMPSARQEDDVQTCPHCQAILKMREWAKVENGKMTGGFCAKCNRPHCGSKRCQVCIPFIARLEREFDMTVKLRQYIRDAGLEPVPKRPLFTGLIQE